MELQIPNTSVKLIDLIKAKNPEYLNKRDSDSIASLDNSWSTIIFLNRDTATADSMSDKIKVWDVNSKTLQEIEKLNIIAEGNGWILDFSLSSNIYK